MKKLVLVAASFLIIAGMTSCKKDYTCTCTYPASSGLTTTNSPYGKTKKKDAQAACDLQNSAATIFQGSCSLK